MYHINRLPNGLTVATAFMPHMASVSLGLWVRVGGRYEPAGLCGVSHFIEHLLFKGTRHRTAKQISQAVESMGGDLNAFTAEENTCYFSKARFQNVESLLEVLLDMFLNSRFLAREIDKERGVIREELAMYLDQPQQHVQELLNETLWPNHPLGRSLTGTDHTIDTMTRAQILQFQRAYYIAENTLITAAGRISQGSLARAVHRYAQRFPQGQPTVFLPAPPEPSRPQIRLFTKQAEQTQIALGIHTCSRHHPARYALRLLNTILGENMSSRLFQIVREERGLAYSIGSALSFFEDTGMLAISAGLDTENLEQTLKLIHNELQRLIRLPPPMAELNRAREYLFGQIDLSLENTTNQMMWVGEQLLGYGRIISPGCIKRQLNQVKPSDIRQIARNIFQPHRLNLAIVGPRSSTAGLLKILTS